MSRYILQSQETGVAVNGNPWIRLEVLDKKGRIKAMLFNYTSLPQDIQDSLLNGVGKVFDISGDIEQFNNENQIKVKTVKLSADQSVLDLLPSVDHDYQQLQDFCRFLVDSIQDEKIKEITKRVLFNEEIWSAFITKVAGKANHHAVVGGLLAHSVGVATAALQLSNFYSDINRSRVVAGGLLHDIGKCKVYTNFEEGLDYNDDGRMFDHIVLGINILNEYTRDLDESYRDEIKQLEHIIVSHHGQLAYGSPVEPNTAEAKVVSVCDGLDAYMDVFHTTSKNAEQVGYNKPATKMIWRDVYVNQPGVQTPYFRIPNVGSKQIQG